MKKWLFSAAVLLILCYGDLLPFENVDAGQMCIVETLFVETRGNEICLYAENLRGCGTDCAEAVESMKQNAPGQLYLRQVKRVVFCQGAEKHVDVLTLPQELPLGAVVYTSQQSAQVLMEDLEHLEKRMETKEQTKRQIPTLAQLENAVLKEAEGEYQ